MHVPHLGLYGLLAASLLGFKWLAARRRPFTAEHRTSVAVVIPVYNEDPEAFRRCLESVLANEPTEVWVVDDGSPDPACWLHASAARRDHGGPTTLHVVRMGANAGKRHALAAAFRRSGCEILVTVDSDTVLAPGAIAEGLRPFADPRVQGVTGIVRALNPVDNVLTRLVDVRYASTFLLDRLAQSAFGSVLCACGSLAFWRRQMVMSHLEDFVAQRFLGVAVQYGDDRRMTNYALLHGRVVVQPTCRGLTMVPNRLGHFLRQQARWNRSFTRETFWALRHLSPRRAAWWLAVVELVSWALLSGLVTVSLHHRLTLLFLVGLCVVAYIRSARYLTDEGRRWVTYAIAPLYAVLHFTLLLPVKVWSILTLRKSGWGTRSTVEVRLDA